MDVTEKPEEITHSSPEEPETQPLAPDFMSQADAPEEESPALAPQAEVDTSVADRLDVDAALAGLPVEFRAAVALRDLAGLDYAEIAAVLDVPPGTVRSRIARGRAALADRLGNHATDTDRPTHRAP